MINKHNFKRGDRAYIKNNGICTIVGIDDKKWFPVEIERADGSRSHFSRDSLENVKTAFLMRLRSLLREFDAHIEPCGCEIEGLSIVLKDNEEIYYKMDDFSPMRNLTADNIMAFDKEGV